MEKTMGIIQLKCSINKGMFTDECVITIRSDGEDVSFFVPTEYVHHGESEREGTITVQSFEENGTHWVVIPDEQRSIIQVPEDNLVAA